MSRLTWFAAGAATGVYALLKARHTARNFTPDGIAARAAALAVGLRTFTSEVSAGMVERESELRDELGVPRLGDRADVPAMIERSGEPPAHAHDGVAHDGRPHDSRTHNRREDAPDGHR